ncbi:MAG: DNA translocase FtsK 4TM domain-containing protein [Bacteroidia bacterium]|nr:DNA translocase FtsK 4TM domain-containing protein [Bacteroidia bacterium]
MSNGNKFKSKQTDDLPEEKPVKKRSSKTTPAEPVQTEAISNNYQKPLRWLGLSCMLLSVFLLIPFFSYLFTHAADFDKVNQTSWLSLLGNADVMVDNWLGKLGAIVAHAFIYNGFGIAAAVFILLSFLLGFKLVFKVDLLPWPKTLKYSFFALLFLSITLGYLMGKHSHLLWLGGVYGYQMSTWLNATIGVLGTGLLLVFAAILFVASVFKYSYQLPVSAQKAAPESVVENTHAPAAGNALRDEVSTPIVMKVKDEIALEIEDPVEPEIFNSAIEADEKEDDEADLEMEVLMPELKPVSLEVTPNQQPIENENAIAAVPMDIALPEDEAVTAENLLAKMGKYDPTLDLSAYKYPTIDLLEDYQSRKTRHTPEEIKAELEANKNKIVVTLGHYNIEIEKIKATIGPTVTLFEIVPKAGIRISKIKNLEDDIALNLMAYGIRIIAPMPGKGTIGIEVPNQHPETVSMRSVIASEKFNQGNFELPLALGRTISNEVFVTDLAKMPHMLMAGATGQGKSVGLNAVLTSLLYSKHPSQVKFVLVDPKKVELTLFKRIERHFLAKLPNEEEAIITDTKKVVATLNSLCIEMDNRYELLKDAQVRNIKEYNQKFNNRRLNPENGHQFLPYIVLVVDEFADLIMTAGREVETPIARLAQLARAIGIHLIIATQRPSVNIITGTIKANFPCRIAFKVTSKIDSRTILDAGGADQLVGNGDMLLSTGADLIRLQCAFVDTAEVEKITDFIGQQRGYPDAFKLPEYIDPNGEATMATDFSASDRDALFEEAAKIIVQHQQGSASLLQRRLKLGYNRAGRLVDQLEAAGIIGAFEGSKAREVKVKTEAELMEMLHGQRV